MLKTAAQQISIATATRRLVEDGFAVLVYTSDDPVVARRLKEAGAASVMPAGSPIGSGQGILNPNNLRICMEYLKDGDPGYPVIVDAGVGTASDATIAMELGCDGVLMNTAIAGAKDPVLMASAMRKDIEAELIGEKADTAMMERARTLREKLAEARKVRLTEEEAELRDTVFPEFTPVEFAKLMRISTWKAVPAGVALTTQGKMVSEVSVIQSGHLNVEIDGRNVHTMKDGEIVGEMSFIGGNPATATVRTITPTRYVAWEQPALRALLARNPAMSSAMVPAFTLPPYWIRTILEVSWPNLSVRYLRIKACTS